ncbi:MAG: hypothetical protein JO001_15665 [Alphaproteobacteria bacterium]|nr:hypothetical protein [Alphaproteobacteria bacterium]
MAREFVIGLFRSKGIAEDAAHRLRTEGVTADLIALIVLHDYASSDVIAPELAALSVDPFVWGDARNSFAPLIANGETALFVAVETEADAQDAVDTIRQYSPALIRVVTPLGGHATGRDVR